MFRLPFLLHVVDQLIYITLFPLANLVNFTSASMKAHIFELIVAVIPTFNTVLKFKPEKESSLKGTRTRVTSAIVVPFSPEFVSGLNFATLYVKYYYG